MNQPRDNDPQVWTFDDLPMISHDGAIDLECPTCGVLQTPQLAPTLSDFTNAAIEHLETHHVGSRSNVA